MADVRVVRVADVDAWRAFGGDGNLVGEVSAFIRPDERCFLRFASCRPEAFAPLVAAAAEELGRDLHVTVAEEDAAQRRLYETLGFSVNRREDAYCVPTDPDVTGLRDVQAPAGFAFARADEVDEDRLRALDDELRQDVPGTDGWQWDEAGFREELEQPSFDPATYLVAVEEDSGEYVGIVRVWNNPKEPRLGFIGVQPRHRGRGLAKALLAGAFAVLYERGTTEVSTGADVTNVASTSLLSGLGARRTGGFVELIRRFAPVAGDGATVITERDGVVLREARADDLDAVDRLTIDGYRPIQESYVAMIGAETYDAVRHEPELAWDERKCAQNRRLFEAHPDQIWVLDRDGDVFGYVTYWLFPEKSYGHIDNNAVRADEAGHGWATFMYRHVLQHFRARGLRFAHVDTGLDDAHVPARRAYEAVGFDRQVPTVEYWQDLARRNHGSFPSE